MKMRTFNNNNPQALRLQHIDEDGNIKKTTTTQTRQHSRTTQTTPPLALTLQHKDEDGNVEQQAALRSPHFGPRKLIFTS